MIYTTEELAEKANVTPRHIRNLCAEGAFPGATKRAGVWFIPKQAAKTWLEERAQNKQLSK